MNRVSDLVSEVPIRDRAKLETRFKELNYNRVELAPALQDAFAGSRNRAVNLARVYATALPSADDHRELFQRAAYFSREERDVLFEGYRKANHPVTAQTSPPAAAKGDTRGQ